MPVQAGKSVKSRQKTFKYANCVLLATKTTFLEVGVFMGEIWGNVKLGLNPLSVLAAFGWLVVMVVGLLVSGFIGGLFAGISIVLTGIVFVLLFLVFASFAGNFLQIAAVQNISNGQIDLGGAISGAISRLKNAFLANIIIILAAIVILVAFAIVGALLGGLLGLSASSAALGSDPALSAVAGGFGAAAGGVIGGLILAYIGLYAIILGVLPFIASYSTFIAVGQGGTIETLRTAFTKSMAMWPKAFGLMMGTIYASVVPIAVLGILLMVLGGINIILGGIVLLAIILVFISISACVGARIYIDATSGKAK